MFLFVDAIAVGAAYGLARSGLRRGFVSFAIDLVGFAIAVVAAVRFAGPLSVLYSWGLSPGWAVLAGGLTVFVPVIVATAIVGGRIGRTARKPGLNMTDRILGVGFGLGVAAIGLMFAFLVSQVVSLPFGLSDAVRRSPTARVLLGASPPLTEALQGVADREAAKIVLYLRQAIRPPDDVDEADAEPDEAADAPDPIRFDAAAPDEISVDTEAEREIWRRVNDERRRRDLPSLDWDEELVSVGRTHARDMYLNGYFAHRSLDGTTPAQRFDEAGVRRRRSGENLSLAPTVTLAHDGLMRSEGHRENILSPGFGKLGVGVYDGPKGLMVVQTFCGGC